MSLISGVHALIYSKDADATRAFLRDVLGFKSVDAGDGWLIFALPPAEVAVHPTHSDEAHELYFMCDDVAATVAVLKKKGVECSPISDRGWGLVTSAKLPGGGEFSFYQPQHPTALRLP